MSPDGCVNWKHKEFLPSKVATGKGRIDTILDKIIMKRDILAFSNPGTFSLLQLVKCLNLSLLKYIIYIDYKKQGVEQKLRENIK